MPQVQTVTIAQALQSSQTGLTVQDTAANIAQAVGNAALVARVSLFELSGPATISATMADQLATLGGKFAAGYPIAVQDSVAAMIAPGNAAGLALATTRTVVDVAYNLLNAAPAAFSGVTSVTMTGTPGLSAAQLVKLEGLPGFTFGAGSHFTFTDSLTAAAPVLIAHPGWFAAATSVSVRLDGSQASAGAVAALAVLANGGKTIVFVPSAGDTALNITAAAHDLAAAAASLNRVGQLVGLHITVSNDGSAISAADAVALTTIAGFVPAQHTLTVADTGAAITASGAALFNHGYRQIAVTSGVFSGIAAELLDPTLHFQAGAAASLQGTPTLNAAQTQILAALPGFSLAPGATLSVADTIGQILAHASAMAHATAIAATDSETVGAAGLAALAQVAAAHPGHFSLAGHTLSVADTAASLLGLSNQAIALGSTYTLTANGAVNAAQFLTLRDTLHVASGGHGLTVSDSAADLLALPGNLALIAATQLNADGTVTAAGATTLAAEPGFSAGGHVLTILDTAANLLGLSPSVLALAGHVALSADQSVSVAQAQALAGLGSVFSTAGHALIVTDTAAALLALPVQVGAIATGYALSAAATLSAAQCNALFVTLGVALNGHQISIQDTPANLLALSPQLTAQASAILLGANGTVDAAQFVALRDGLGVQANGHTLTVSDTAAALLGLSGNLGLVGTTLLSADANVTAAQALTLSADPGFSTAGHVLTITDSAANLLALPGGLSSHLVLGADQSVTASQAVALLALGSAFSTGGHALTVTDTAAALLALPGGVGAIATGFALSADGTVSASGLGALIGLGVALNGHALTVSDTPANLLALPPQLLGEASGFSLSAGGTVTEAQFATLRDTLGVAANGHTLTVADTAADLLALSGDLSLDGATGMTADATVSAAQAESLASDPAFSTGGHVLTVNDSAANLLALAPGVLAIAGSLSLSANATVSASQLAALAALNVSLGGHTLTVSDTPANLLAVPVQALALAGAVSLSAGGTVSEAQFLTLRDTLAVAGNGHTLTVADTAANLLALSGDLSLISATILTAPANVSAAQATALASEPGFSTGDNGLIVTDTAANLLALPTNVQTLSGTLVLAASQSVTAAQVTALAALGPDFLTGGHSLTVTDTAASLLSLSQAAMALAGATALSADATVNAAQFTTLWATLHVGLNGHALTVSDTPANLLALPLPSLSTATAFALSTGGTVNEAQFLTLRDALGVTGNANTLTVADNAANLLMLSGNLALVGATQLTGNANVTAAQAQSLASEPGFSTGGYVLTVTDTAANLLSLPNYVQLLAGAFVLNGSQTVSGAQITALAALGSSFSTGGFTLTVHDTAATLLSLPAGANALAGAYTLSADATVNAAQFTTLTGTLHVGLSGHALIVADTPANLLGLPSQALPYATGFALAAGGTVSESQFITLRDTIGVSGNGHTLTIADTAADLLALSGNLSLVGATQLSTNATVTAVQAQALAAEPGFSLNGHVLTVTDSAANLLGLTTPVQTLSGHLVLSASQSVNGAQAAGLAALGGLFSTGGNTLTVTDTAANLLSLPSGVAAIAGAYALSADGTVNAAGFTTLTGTLNVALNGHALTVADTPANLLAISPQALAEASYALSAGGTVSEAQFVTLRDVYGVNGNGHTLTVSDTASDLLSLSGNLALDGATQLSADAGVDAAQATALAAEPGFATAGHVLTITDTAANLLALTTSLQTLSGHLVLNASQSVNAAQATGLAALGSAFSTGGYTLTVTDTAANLLSLPSGVGAIAGAYALSADAAVSAAGFTQLRDGLGVALNGHAITILDSASALAGLTGSLADASACILSANGTVSAAGAAVLAGEPGFSTAGHALTIADTAANLLGLGAPLQSLASAFTLSASQTVNAAQLAGLAAYGIKFSDGAYTLNVADNAAHLAALTAPELALVGSVTLSQTAVVSAATATTLAALPGFALGGGVSLTVQDSAANLLALAPSVLGVATHEALPGGVVTLSAAQAAGLDALPHFENLGTTITVQDSVAALQGNAGWASVANLTDVLDTAANLASNAGSALLQSANAATLSGNGTVSAAQAAALSTIPAYTSGAYTLTVADSAAAIAQNATAINLVGTTAVVDTTGSVSAAQAEELTLLSNAGKLNFLAGDTLTIADNYAALTSAGNAAGVALASNIVITDSAANLAVAASHNWGSLVPSYVLDANATLTGAQAIALAGLGSHFLTGGYTLAVQDNAANVVAASAALTSLGITATVSDTAADIGAHASALQGLGGHLAAVQVTDGSAITPATAAALAPLAGKLTGGAVEVAGNAAGVEANLGALEALGAHVAITLTDSAAAVAADAADLANLGNALTIALTDSFPVSASVAAGAGALAARFALGTTLNVTDTVADIAAVSGTLANMGSALGTITLSGGNAANLSQVVSLLPLDSHLGVGVGLAVAALAGDITVFRSYLLALQSDGHLSSVTDSGESSATVIANASALNAVGATVHVTDTLAGFDASAASLAGISGLASVFISDTANPTFTLSLSQYAAEASVIGRVTNTYNVVIADTAGAIEADLASASSILEGMGGINYTLTVTGGAPLVLSQALAVQPAVAAVLSHFAGTLDITGVDVAHLAAVAAVTTSGIIVSDSTANIEVDLGLPSNGSVILANVSAISSITASGGGTIAVTAYQALRAGFDDGPNSVFAKLTGAGLVVTDASVAQANTLIGAIVAPVGIYVDDIAANITAALINSASPIMTALSTIVDLNVQDGQAIVLTEAQDTAANVNDGVHAALTKITGGAIDVTGVTTAELGTVEGGAVTPTRVSVVDTGGDISAALTTLLSDRANLGPITVTSGQVVLSASQALMAGVADGAGSLVSLLPGHAYAVSGATVAQLSLLVALPQSPGAIAVTDSSANIAADLAGSNSKIADYATSVTVTGGTLSLTDAQAHNLLNNGHASALGLIATGQTIDISGVPVSDISVFSAMNGDLAAGVTLHLEVSDTAAALATDLALGAGSSLTNDAAFINGVTLTGAGGTLTASALSAVAGIAGLNANGISVPVSGDASDIAGLGASARALAGTHVTVTDTAGNVGAVFNTLQTEYQGGLTINLTGSGTITLTEAQYAADLPTIAAITSTSRIVVTGNAAQIASIGPTLLADTHVAAVQVTDYAANLVSHLNEIAALGGLATVTMADTTPISAALAQALVNANLLHLVATGVEVADTGAQLAAMAESSSAAATFLNSHLTILTASSNVRLVDAQALAAISGLDTNGNIINVWDTAAYLTAPGAAAELSALMGSSFINGIYLKTNGGTVTLTAAKTLALLGISGISVDNPDGSINTITVSDTAANLDGDSAALQSAGSAYISAYVINASATVSGSVLSDLQGISATTAPGVSLTLSDTAANILAAAAVNGATVQASAWNLSANASVTSSQLLSLAALPNFSAAGHTLTVALGSDTALGSVAQANELGALGPDLVVTGHVYTISGSVSSLSGLTTAGAAVAHVVLSDTFSNLASLSSSSPLLTGTIAVTDVSNPTAASVQSFLATLSAAGVSDSNVSFPGGAQIQVYDSVADLRTLTGSTAWTANALLQSHIPLYAYDSAADLDNPANTAFLNTLAAQVLRFSGTVSAASATALRNLSNFSLAGNTLTVSDTATNLLNSVYGTGLTLASSIQLSGAASLNAAQAEQLLQTNHFTLNQTLNITDSSASLLDGTLQGLIAGDSYVHVSLAAPETVDAHVASELASLQGFSDTTNMNIVDSSSYLLAPGASAAELVAASVSLAGDETVSANTILRLEEIPHFIASGGTLTLASDDFVNAQTLKAIADLGSNFSEGGHSLTLTQDDLALTPTEYAALGGDVLVLNGHVISAELVNDSVTDTSNTMALTATGVAGASVNVYDHSGTLLSSTVEGSASFTVSAPDGGSGNNFSITETVGGVESAPVVVLNASTLEGLVSGASASFSNSGEIQVGSGEYLNLYTSGASLPNAPALVYDPTAHTISLDIPNASPVVLVTLGASTHPASIDPTEILVKHHS